MKELTITDCSKRRLEDTYLVIYAIKNEINIKKGEYIEKEDIYTLVGIDKKKLGESKIYYSFLLMIIKILKKLLRFHFLL